MTRPMRPPLSFRVGVAVGAASGRIGLGWAGFHLLRWYAHYAFRTAKRSL
jgi:ribosomal protein S5